MSTYSEPFGPIYVRPDNPDCPDCDCCTAALCAAGRASVSECAGHVGDETLIERVTGCPCSAESTRGTLAWRAGMVRAVTFATEKPLRQELEELLTLVAADSELGDLADLLPKVAVRRYVWWRPGMRPVLTDFGRAYLEARTGPRVESLVTVQSVDKAARTALVVIPVSADQPVTVPLDALANSRTQLDAESLLTARLYAEVNPGARTADDVVVTKVRNPAVIPPRPGSPDGAR
ncbi:hypothetical protein GCM10010250_21310 [Streptomyces althioticus]|uniref:hypothetical protein n=1 Tax=Streptomyces althioticus TaxID=83380 RepID=UPI00187723CB|nr:hypothetical protein GCM10010250_21310 [Streptomyces althioticus]